MLCFYQVDDRQEYLYLAAHKGIGITGLEKVHISEGFTGKAARSRSFITQHVSRLEGKYGQNLKQIKGQPFI